MDELISGALRLLASLVKVFLQIKVIELFFYGIGFFISKVCTLGRFPRTDGSESDSIKVNYIGLITFIVVILAIGVLNSTAGNV